MTKIRTTVHIGGQDLSITSDDSEEYVQQLAVYVDKQVRDMQKEYPSVSTSTAYLLVALNVADELYKVREKYDTLDSRLSQLLSVQALGAAPVKRPFEAKTPLTTK